MKEFDINLAKAGKPVCTRDGRKERIICFDVKGDKPIIALIEAKGNHDSLIEIVEGYFINGHSVFEGGETGLDLMMLPEKKEGWVNIYRNQIHDTLESAEEGRLGSSKYIKTIKVEWEE